jgi:hypothetical protein
MDETNRICPWCSTPIPASQSACPKCGAAVEGATVADLPGVTVVDPKALDPGYVPSVLSTPTDHDPFQPPSEEVRREMRKLELEAQIERAGTELMNPTGDESIPVGPPSIEAIAAYKAGLLDKTGPAGETDLDELASPWKEPELDEGGSKSPAAPEDAK